ncbi:MAG: flagellar basal body P-ring protein FlgI [Armatimonadetes bacterium]|nr:flagellar basal body P-ring protein FlgI [Armatimonadota bacterium]
MKALPILALVALAAPCAYAQKATPKPDAKGAAAKPSIQIAPTGRPAPQVKTTPEQQERQDRDSKIHAAENEGVEVQLSAIGKFRGARSNSIVGYGIVVGLNGTGDSSQVGVSQTLMANVLSRWGTSIDPKNFKSKNIALVSVTSDMPAFVSPGTKIDVLVQSIGDAKSLEGGVLLPTGLGPMGDMKAVFAVASGPVSTGGYTVSNNGSSSTKNYPNVGKISSGADVQRSVDTQYVFPGNVLYYDLQSPDFTTALRVAEKIKSLGNGFEADAIDGATVQIRFPLGMAPVAATSQIESVKVFANTPAKVVINARNGVIVVGGNIRLAPAMIAYGSLKVRIDTENSVSQPNPLTQGQTKEVSNSATNAQEDTTQIALVPPSATVSDLAEILQALKLSAQDLISIFQELSRQGALKAQVEQT